MISLFFANIFGWIIAHKRLVLYIVGGIVLFICVSLIYRACHKAPHLDEKQIQRAQDAIAKQDREEMVKVLTEAEVAEKQIDANLAEGEHQKLEAIQEAKRKAAKMTNDELAAELERLAQE